CPTWRVRLACSTVWTWSRLTAESCLSPSGGSTTTSLGKPLIGRGDRRDHDGMKDVDRLGTAQESRGPRARRPRHQELSYPLRLLDPVEPRRVPPHDQVALARRHVGELLGDRLTRARPGRVAVRVVARPEA